MDTKPHDIMQILKEFNQEYVLSFWNDLTDEEKNILANQVRSIDFAKMNMLYYNSTLDDSISYDRISPIPYIDRLNLTKDELKHYFACANVVVSRAGANAICELLALRKPNILIPLGLEASRGDQILNAESFENQGYSYVLQEKDVTSETLLNAVNSVYEDRDKYIEAMHHSKLANPIETIVNLANQLASRKKKR